jgi:Domain of unknown function (DUF3883)
MPSDYRAIRTANERQYGTAIGRIGPMLLANRYADRAHFIFELLQNAEDALARRTDTEGPKTVSFSLEGDLFRLSHWGKPFDTRDVNGVCGIGVSTKEDLTDIGRFGIGFKSVYSVTRHPEIHSGDEDFAIENFVWPATAPPIRREALETVILLPLQDNEAKSAIEAGLQRLDPRILLFLRQIEDIAWTSDSFPKGKYHRGSTIELAPKVRRVRIEGGHEGKPVVNEEWLIFSKEVDINEKRLLNQVEIAFRISRLDEKGTEIIQPVAESPLVVFFPTVVDTHLGFLLQGPFRTTPSRDNVPKGDKWNQSLVLESAKLLIDAIEWLAKSDLFHANALRCMPLDPDKYAEPTDVTEGSMFAPLFSGLKEGLTSRRLLPTFDGRRVEAGWARIARTRELRELLNPQQLATLFGVEGELFWLPADFSEDENLRAYCRIQLGIEEITPEMVVTRLERHFLETQPDAWTEKLYEFLNSQKALRERIKQLPVVRLSDGSQVVAISGGQPQAFLPSSLTTEFPTVRRSVCSSPDSQEFLKSLGLTEPDPVDDVVRNVLPRYRRDDVQVGDGVYYDDFNRILRAYLTDSQAEREKLLSALRECRFVRSVDAGSGVRAFSKAAEVYLPSERLTGLFKGVLGVQFPDDSLDFLREKGSTDLLASCGADRGLARISIKHDFTPDELAQMRYAEGNPGNRRDETVGEYTLRGLDALFRKLEEIPNDERRRRADLLWDALCDFSSNHGNNGFFGTYRWFSRIYRSWQFPASFTKALNSTAWVPDNEGVLRLPSQILFESTGWKEEPVLLKRIPFRPPDIETLAQAVEIDSGVFDLLKRHGLTTVASLEGILTKLGVHELAKGAATAPSGGILQVENSPGQESKDSEESTEPTVADSESFDGGPGAGGLSPNSQNLERGTPGDSRRHVSRPSPQGGYGTALGVEGHGPGKVGAEGQGGRLPLERPDRHGSIEFMEEGIKAQNRFIVALDRWLEANGTLGLTRGAGGGPLPFDTSLCSQSNGSFFIEIKACSFPAPRFYWSESEVRFAEKNEGRYWIVLIPQEDAANMEQAQWISDPLVQCAPWTVEVEWKLDLKVESVPIQHPWTLQWIPPKFSALPSNLEDKCRASFVVEVPQAESLPSGWEELKRQLGGMGI